MDNVLSYVPLHRLADFLVLTFSTHANRAWVPSLGTERRYHFRHESVTKK